MEIERKWLLKAFPVGQHKTHCYIFQTYLASYDDCEIRIRYCEPALDIEINQFHLISLLIKVVEIYAVMKLKKN